MRKFNYLLTTLFMISILVTSGQAKETYFTFQAESPKQIAKLSRIISIDNVSNGIVHAYANDAEWQKFLDQNIDYTTLPHPGSLIVPSMADKKDAVKAWDAYPTYSAYISTMNQFVIDYPGLCEVVNIGSTNQGRDLLFIRISDNISIEEDEPEVMFTSSMHGDETTGYVLMLRLIDSLLTGYATDPYIQQLVDGLEIWINPLANPDGTYASGNSSVSGATRGNANSIDMNRNFRDPLEGHNPDGNSYQVETVHMMNFAQAHSFIISANFHGGTEVVNYPWDTWIDRHADDAWWQTVSHMWADTAQAVSPATYINGYNDGITNGYDWYRVAGGRQDFMNYWAGCREMTMEISDTKLLPAAQLPNHWIYNKLSFLQYFENALYGIRGIVTDASTTLPLAAKVHALGHDFDSSEVRTDPDIGDYHRMLAPGIYSLIFSSPGYYPDTVTGIVVSNGLSVRVDVPLTPLPNEPLMAYQDNNAPPLNPGDNSLFKITVNNQGIADATNMSGTLSSADPNVTITQALSNYPTVAALGGTGQSLTDYAITINPATPLYHSLQFNLDLTADGGYNNQVTFNLTVGQLTEGYESGDFTSLSWQLSGSANWQTIATNPHTGTYTAQSGFISHNQSTDMSITLDVTSSGNISFWYKVSSESGWDFLRFKIDGAEQAKWSGSAGWIQVSYPVSTGIHTFSWSYTKDGNTSVGSDKGWIDDIIFPPVSAIVSNLTISTISLPGVVEGNAYSEQLQATGVIGIATWSDKNSDLTGTGLSLSSTGLISGTPFSTGTYPFTALVTDDGSGSDEKLLSVTVSQTLSISTLGVPSGDIGIAYSTQFLATGGTGTLVWFDKNNDLPGTGMFIVNNGTLMGTPNSTGPINFVIEVNDGGTGTDETSVSININPLPAITTTTLPDADKDIAYNMQLTSTGGTTPLVWTDLNNDLPGTGISLSLSGLLAGTPITNSTINFTASLTDSIGVNVTQPLSLTILSGCCTGQVGDADYSGSAEPSVGDISAIVDHLFGSGNPLTCYAEADADQSGGANPSSVDISVADISAIIDHLFGSGDPLPDCL